MMECYIHPRVQAQSSCIDCGQRLCADCIFQLPGGTYCAADYAIARYDPVEGADTWIGLPPMDVVGVEVVPSLSIGNLPSRTSQFVSAGVGDESYPRYLAGRIDWLLIRPIVSLILLAGVVIYVNYRTNSPVPGTSDVCGAACLILLAIIGIFIMNGLTGAWWRMSRRPNIALVLTLILAVASFAVAVWAPFTLIGYYAAHTYCAFGFC